MSPTQLIQFSNQNKKALKLLHKASMQEVSNIVVLFNHKTQAKNHIISADIMCFKKPVK